MSGVGDLLMEVTPDLLLRGYACGIFPMSEGADDPGIFFVEPRMRGVVPLDGLNVSRRLARTVRSGKFELRIDSEFERVVALCAEAAPDRPETWINPRIRRLYGELYRMGHAHSVESWQDGELVGGLYGVSLKGAFFGESMFSRVSDASKVALVHLVDRLRERGYVLLDTQFITDHLARMGAVEVPREDYLSLLEAALQVEADWGD